MPDTTSTNMLAITAPKFTNPSQYELTEVATPTLATPRDVLIKVHAAGVNPIDVKKADGILKLFLTEQFPYKIGYDCAGVVSEAGAEVDAFKPGDEVYVRLPEAHRGSWSEYVTCDKRFVAIKPSNTSFTEAASIPLACTTALQALRSYKGSLEGKTVFVPAGLSGTGLFACQLAKKVFKAGKVITTVSTSKVAKVPELLGEGVVDQIIDYTKQSPESVIAPGSVNFILDSTAQAMSFLPLMTPGDSHIVSISLKPSGKTLQNSEAMKRPENPTVPWLLKLYLDGEDAYRRMRANRSRVGYTYLFMQPSGEDLESIRGWVEEGKVKAVVGARADMRKIDQVRDACRVVYDAKGGIGKTVIQVVQD